MFDYIDIHSHIYFPDFDSDREEVIREMKERKIATISIGTSIETSKEVVSLSEKHENLFACIGQHPGDLNSSSVFEEELKNLAAHPRVVAIGECGLDYFRISGDGILLKQKQKEIFESHIELSLSSGKPLMLHIRSSHGTQDAMHDALEILENHTHSSSKKLRGNAHFFAGDLEALKRLLAIGFSVSFTGVLTFTHDYDDYVKYAPLDRIMSETDSPFVAPVPYRGKRSAPLYVPEVVKAIARIRGEEEDVVKTTLKDNAVAFFNLT